MTPHPGISILLPVYFPVSSAKAVLQLKSAIDSIFIQNYGGDLEVIVIDDGSPTPIAHYRDDLGHPDKVIRILRLARNRGIVFALNQGLRQATHGFIARIDADDRWLPTKLDKQMRLFQADPGLSIVGTGMTRVSEAGNIIDQHIRPADWNALLRFFHEIGCPFPHGSILARREVYRILGGYSYDALYRHCEDFALWGLWLRFFKATMVEEALYEYRVGSQSISALHAAQQHNVSLFIRQKFASLGLSDTLSVALPAFASHLGIGLIDAGRLAYTIWDNPKATFSLPKLALPYLSAILPDCSLIEVPASKGWQWWEKLDIPYKQGLILNNVSARPVL